MTRAELHEWVRRLFHERTTQKLSVASLETLAVIAYKQPVTAPEISEIRGVNTVGVLGTLVERHLVKVVGRKQVVGRPFLYGTTREFLDRFGLNDLSDLPKVEDMSELLGFELPLDSERARAADTAAVRAAERWRRSDSLVKSEVKSQKSEVRINKLLSMYGIASRRAADTFITQGRVELNGHVVTALGTKADPEHDEIKVDGRRLKVAPVKRYLLHEQTGGRDVDAVRSAATDDGHRPARARLGLPGTSIRSAVSTTTPRASSF